MVWPGFHIMKSADMQYKMYIDVGVEGLLINAYDFITKRLGKTAISLVKRLRESGVKIMMDSGGFQAMKHGLNYSYEDAFKKQVEVGCDIAVQLDMPINPTLKKNEVMERIDTTVDNYSMVLELNDKNGKPLRIMPVAHGYDIETLDYAIDRIVETNGKPEFIGIGSIVPLIYSRTNVSKVGFRDKVPEILAHIRKRLKDSYIHAFGIGDMLSYIVVYCGIDSYDTHGWFKRTGVRMIRLPGISDRNIEPKPNGRSYLVDNRLYKRGLETIVVNERKAFMNCDCPICRKFKPKNDSEFEEKWKEKLEYLKDDWSWKYATHNLWVTVEESKELRKHVEMGDLESFVESRMKASRHYSLFVKAKSTKEGIRKRNLPRLTDF